MQVGAVVNLKVGSTRIGLVIDVIQKKVWRVHDQGIKVNWDTIEPEPHAVVLYGDGLLNIPTIDLEVTCEDN